MDLVPHPAGPLLPMATLLYGPAPPHCLWLHFFTDPVPPLLFPSPLPMATLLYGPNTRPGTLWLPLFMDPAAPAVAIVAYGYPSLNGPGMSLPFNVVQVFRSR